MRTQLAGIPEALRRLRRARLSMAESFGDDLLNDDDAGADIRDIAADVSAAILELEKIEKGSAQS